jgi:hypothetical protein
VLTLTDFFQVVVWTVSLFNLTQKPTFTEKKKAGTRRQKHKQEQRAKLFSNTIERIGNRL